MDEKQVVALFTLPVNLMAGAELVEKFRYFLQEQDPTAQYVAEPMDGSGSDVPDGFDGFRIVRRVAFSDQLRVTAERQAVVDPSPTADGPE